MMWDRVLLALDEYESGQAAMRFTTELALVTHSDVRVLHIRALSGWARSCHSKLQLRPRIWCMRPFSRYVSPVWS